LKLIELTTPGGFIYIELPLQIWKSYVGNNMIRNALLRIAKKYRVLHKILDLYSTAFRVKFMILPPFGFAPMREHVNFFTLPAIVKLGERLNLVPEISRINPFCGIQILFRKPIN
jgi:hypothetical protein